MSCYRQLLTELDELDQRMKAAFEAEKQQAIADIRTRIAECGLDLSTLASHLSTRRERVVQKRGPLPAKYRDPHSGKTWSGRGGAPNWIIGQDYGRFAV